MNKDDDMEDAKRSPFRPAGIARLADLERTVADLAAGSRRTAAGKGKAAESAPAAADRPDSEGGQPGPPGSPRR